MERPANIIVLILTLALLIILLTSPNVILPQPVKADFANVTDVSLVYAWTNITGDNLTIGATAGYRILEEYSEPSSEITSGDAGANQTLYDGSILLASVSLAHIHGNLSIWKYSASSPGATVTYQKLDPQNIGPPEPAIVSGDAGANQTLHPSILLSGVSLFHAYGDGAFHKGSYSSPGSPITWTTYSLNNLRQPADIRIWIMNETAPPPVTFTLEDTGYVGASGIVVDELPDDALVVAWNYSQLLDARETVGNSTLVFPISGTITHLQIYLNASGTPVLVYETPQADPLYGNIRSGRKYMYSQSGDHFFIVTYLDEPPPPPLDQWIGSTRAIAFPFGNDSRVLSIFTDNITITRETVSQAYNHSAPTLVYNQPGGIDLQLYIKSVGYLLKIIIQNQNGGELLSEHQSGISIKVLNYSNLYPIFEGGYYREKSLSIPRIYPEVLVNITYNGWIIHREIVHMNQTREVILTLWEDEFYDYKYNLRRMFVNSSFSTREYISGNWLRIVLNQTGPPALIRLSFPSQYSAADPGIMANVTYIFYRDVASGEYYVFVSRTPAEVLIHDPEPLKVRVVNPLGPYPPDAIAIKVDGSPVENDTDTWMSAGLKLIQVFFKGNLAWWGCANLTEPMVVTVPISYRSFSSYTGMTREILSNSTTQLEDLDPMHAMYRVKLILSGDSGTGFMLSYRIPCLNETCIAYWAANSSVTSLVDGKNLIFSGVFASAIEVNVTTSPILNITCEEALKGRKIPLPVTVSINGTNYDLQDREVAIVLEPAKYIVSFPDYVGGFKLSLINDTQRQTISIDLNDGGKYLYIVYKTPARINISIEKLMEYNVKVKVVAEDYYGSPLQATLALETSTSEEGPWYRHSSTKVNGTGYLALERAFYDYWIRLVKEEDPYTPATQSPPLKVPAIESAPPEESPQPNLDMTIIAVVVAAALIAGCIILKRAKSMAHSMPKRRRVLRGV